VFEYDNCHYAGTRKAAVEVGTCEASRFDSNSNRPFRFDSIRKWWDDSKFSNRPYLPIARRSQTTQTINGA